MEILLAFLRTIFVLYTYEKWLLAEGAEKCFCDSKLKAISAIDDSKLITVFVNNA